MAYLNQVEEIECGIDFDALEAEMDEEGDEDEDEERGRA